MKRTLGIGLVAMVAAGLGACGGDGNGGTPSSPFAAEDPGAGGGSGGPGFGAGGTGDAGNGYCGSDLTGTVRDFSDSHPDFEAELGTDRGYIEGTLGADGKPVYKGGSGTATTHGKGPFDQWFRDVGGVNQSMPLTLPLRKGQGNVFTFDDQEFFPIDGQLGGNEGRKHNYHFTFELHTKFEYKGGEVFKFTGDDDLFTFINGKLGIDLGGVHGAQDQEIDLDKEADRLGIQKGGTYALDFFFAERHTSESHFRIDTTIASFVDCGGGNVR